MKPLVIAVAVIAGCDGNPDPFPVNPGGGGSGTEGRVDAGIDGGDASATINGRVCLINDPRNPVTCANAGAAGLTVTLDGETGLTADNGSFVIKRPPTPTVWRVSGSGIEPSALQFGNVLTIPAIDSLIYAEMLAATQAIIVGGNGALIMQVSKANVLASGVTATSLPAPDSQTFYDGPDVLEWDTDQTGEFGVVWVPSLFTGTVQVTLDDGGPTVVSGIPIFADTITFVFAEIP